MIGKVRIMHTPDKCFGLATTGIMVRDCGFLYRENPPARLVFPLGQFRRTGAGKVNWLEYGAK